jgi:hypothetical protein
VIYHPRNVVLIGTIPGDAGALRFRIEGKMRRIKTLLGPKG